MAPAVPAKLDRSPPAEEVDEEDDQRDDEQQVDEPTRHVEDSPSQQPCDYQDCRKPDHGTPRRSGERQEYEPW